MTITYNYTKQNGETRDIITDGRFEEFTPKYIKKNYKQGISYEDNKWVWTCHGLNWIPHTHARVYDTENQGWRTLFKNKINHSEDCSGPLFYGDGYDVTGDEEEVEGEQILLPSDQETNTEGMLENINNRVIRIEELLESVIGHLIVVETK
jgi:hypothetical protein